MQGFLIGMAIVAVCAPFGMWAVRWSKRQRGGAVLVSGLLLMFGMSMQVTPPPPPQMEQVQRQAGEEDEDDGE